MSDWTCSPSCCFDSLSRRRLLSLSLRVPCSFVPILWLNQADKTMQNTHVNSTRTGSAKALKLAANLWFAVAFSGLCVFGYYIFVVYGKTAFQGNWQGWNKVMTRGYTAGDTVGNSAIVLHLLFAFLLTLGGIIQLIPQIRRHAPTLHRWNGRLFLLSACVASIAGFYLIWVRGTVGDWVQHTGTTLNGLLIVVCAAMALRYALARKIAEHRRWALRLFMLANGVWFFRVGLMAWLMVNQAPIGFDPKTFTGPFLSLLTFAQSLLPLAALELYFYAQSSREGSVKLFTAVAIFVLTLVTIVGIVGAFMGMWRPHL
jgi:Predicted membrane protein (DUF2306)